jgi:hypothetical protein
MAGILCGNLEIWKCGNLEMAGSWKPEAVHCAASYRRSGDEEIRSFLKNAFS